MNEFCPVSLFIFHSSIKAGINRYKESKSNAKPKENKYCSSINHPDSSIEPNETITEPNQVLKRIKKEITINKLSIE